MERVLKGWGKKQKTQPEFNIRLCLNVKGAFSDEEQQASVSVWRLHPPDPTHSPQMIPWDMTAPSALPSEHLLRYLVKKKKRPWRWSSNKELDEFIFLWELVGIEYCDVSKVNKNRKVFKVSVHLFFSESCAQGLVRMLTMGWHVKVRNTCLKSMSTFLYVFKLFVVIHTLKLNRKIF